MEKDVDIGGGWWLVVNGKRRYWSRTNEQDLEEKLMKECGNDYFMMQNGRVIGISEIDINQVIQVCSRSRGCMIGSLFARFASKKM
jgi:hypothetical protein